MNVLLVSILRNSNRNLSCLSLFSSLTANNIKTKLLFLPQKDEYIKEELKKFILSNKFDIIGISVMTDGFYFAKSLTQDIKKYFPEVHVIWGGIHPTVMPNECLDYADSICIGEGEKTLLFLVDKISKNEDFSNLPGIGAKLSDGNFNINSPRPLIDNLDSFNIEYWAWRFW